MATREAGLKGSGMGFSSRVCGISGFPEQLHKIVIGPIDAELPKAFSTSSPRKPAGSSAMASLKDEHAYLDADRFTQRPFSRSSGTRPGSGIRLSTCVDGDFYSCAACVCPALQGWVVPVVIN